MLKYLHWLPANQFDRISHEIQQALDSGHETTVFQLDLSAAFDKVSNVGLLKILYMLRTFGSVPSVLTLFLTNRPHRPFILKVAAATSEQSG